MITEKDLITYVFNRSALAASKIFEIENDENIQGEIEFFKNLKNNLDDEFPQEVKRKISEVIPDYSQENIFELFPIDNISKINSKLAAASDYQLERTQEVSSYTDKTSSFLIRINKSKDKSVLFVFPLKEKVVKNITLMIFPSEKEYYLESSEDALEIPSSDEINTISLFVSK